MFFYHTYPPTQKLIDFVRELQILHIRWENNEPLPPPFITCLANTEQNLYFYPKDGIKLVPDINSAGIEAPLVIITGPKNKPIGLKFGKDYLMLKVAFQPTGLYRILHIPMQKTVNTGLDAGDFFGKDILDINIALGNAGSYDEMIEIVSSFLEIKIENDLDTQEPIDRVAIEMLNPCANLSLEEWASMACLSLRQFERNFKLRVGISPKMYTRIVRFEHAMKIKSRTPEKSWSDIALVSEYTDASHLLKEFRQFADFPPGSLLNYQTSGYGDFPSG
jgi:AraC-like DNA-binding protein